MKLPRLLLAAALLSACQFVHENNDDNSRPDVSIGTGATILWPGQPPPVLGAPGAQTASTGSGPGASSSSSSSSGSPPSSSGPELTMIAGTSVEKELSTKERKLPIIGPIATLFGYPFWIFGKTVHQKAEAEARKRAAGGEPLASGAPAGGRDDHERARLEAENQRVLEELQKRGSGAAPPEPAAGARSEPSAGSGGKSIGDELAALRQRVAARAPAQPAGSPSAAPVTPGDAPSEAVDRNGDGRPDLWTYHEQGVRTREAFDEDSDGRIDRVRRYSADGQLSRVDEDLDLDGTLEAVTLFEADQPTRRRVDSDGNGEPDLWSFYAGGEVIRNERDRDGDGFRDLITHYQGGHLLREEEDRNADGRPDVVVLYRDGEISQRDEDADLDGTIDVQSFYENGKLARKVVNSPETIEPSAKPNGS
jgi:hypothetical protein